MNSSSAGHVAALAIARVEVRLNEQSHEKLPTGPVAQDPLSRIIETNRSDRAIRREIRVFPSICNCWAEFRVHFRRCLDGPLVLRSVVKASIMCPYALRVSPHPTMTNKSEFHAE